MSPKSETTILFPAQNGAANPDNTPALPKPAPPSGVRRRTPSRRRFDAARLGLATLLGLMTWLVIDYSRMEDQTVEAKLVVHIPAGYQFARAAVAGVDLTLRGTRPTMQNLQKNLRLDISVGEEQAATGDVLLRLREAVFSGIPDHVTTLRVEPETLVVSLVRNETQYLEVEVVTTANLPEGYTVGLVAAEPARVAVTGPQAEMMRLAVSGEKVQTEPVDLTGKSRTESRSVRLKPPLLDGEPLTMDRSSVFVTIEIDEAPVTRVIERVPVRLLLTAPDMLGGPPRGAWTRWVEPAEVTVTVSGQRLLVNSLTPEQLVIYVTPSALIPDSAVPGRYTARLNWLKPELGAIVKIEPDRVAWSME